MKRVAAAIPQYLNALGIALLVVGVLLAPSGPSQAAGTPYPATCAGSVCGATNGNCNSQNPNANNVCAGTCVNPPDGTDCSGCVCRL